MLKIRLKRIGKKHQPVYRIVVTEHTQPVSGEYVEKIGLYDPFTKKIDLDQEKAMDWMNKGAKPSNTVAKLFEKSGLKHKLVVIKKFAAKSKKQLEAEKKEDEEKKKLEQVQKEAQKEAFEKEVEEKKAEVEETKVQESEEKLPEGQPEPAKSE
ncbi:MAG: 30S ribosomal protein S16 [uncultured bacterium]|nr:MAG: 30S ribosomal protein S16 [uncultured bacterium]